MKGRALCLALVLAAAFPARAERLDGIAAVVDDSVILLSDVERTAGPVMRQLERQRGPLPEEVVRELKGQALQSLIDDHLILATAQRMQIEASAEEVDRTIESIAREEGAAVDEVYAAAERQGLGREAYRQQLSEQLVKMKVLSSAVRSRVAVTEPEIEELYQQRFGSAPAGLRARVLHILLAWPPEAKEADREKTRALAAQVRGQAEAGTDFAQLARAYSRAPSAANGGLTVFREGEAAPELAPFVFGAEPGTLSPLIETEYGVNLLLVLDRYDPSRVSREQVRDRLRAEIAERKSRPELERWVQDLRKNRYIEVIAPELR